MPLPEPVALPSSTCAGCGGVLADDARFCPSCGTPRQAPEGPPPDERRLATVVIGDLAGFTALAETLDPERVKQLVDRLFGRLAADVAAHGGTVDKVVGDAIVALFGAPVAHEDDPERAVRAALAMQRTVRAVGVEEDVDLRMRIGVNTGEVLVGGIAADDSWTAMGDAVNVAARLESAADPGAVLVGEQTHRATKHRITFRRRGPLTVRGRREPLDTWVALRPIGEPGSELDRRRGPVVGREVEERFLDAILDVAVARRRAHLVELIGDAGVGKRMLADAFVERARQRHDALVLEARIPPYGEASMWTPAADMLRNAVGLDIDLDDEAAMTTVVAGAMGMSPDDPEAARMASALHELMELSPDRADNVEAARAAATAAIVTLVRHLAERRPIVAVLANIQWADQAIIDLMTDVLMGLRRLPVMAVTTSRVGDPTDHVPDISAFTDAVNVSWLRLGPLEDDDARALARELLGPATTDEAVSAAVRRSGGNPLMLEEIAALADEGVRADHVEDMPLTLRGLLSARLDVLDPAERRIVEDAAMIGWTGPVDMLLAVATDRGEREAAALLEVLVDRDLFVIEGDSYRFKTDALREAAYLRLPKRERVERHRDIGRRLAHPSGGGTTLRRRAQHLATAAELAASMGPVPDDLRTDAIEALDAAAEWAGQRDPAVSLVFADRAIALADDAPWTIRLHRARALAELGRIDEATAAATAIVDADPSAAVTALALVVVGQGLQSRGHLEESTRVLEEAVAAARRSEDEHALATALRMLGMTLIFRGMEQPAARAVHEAGEVHERLGDVAGMAWAEQHEAWIAFNAGDLARASLLAVRARDRFAAEGNRLGTAFTAGLLGWIDFLAGDLDGGDGEGRAGPVHRAAAGDPRVRGWPRRGPARRCAHVAGLGGLRRRARHRGDPAAAPHRPPVGRDARPRRARTGAGPPRAGSRGGRRGRPRSGDRRPPRGRRPRQPRPDRCSRDGPAPGRSTPGTQPPAGPADRDPLPRHRPAPGPGRPAGGRHRHRAGDGHPFAAARCRALDRRRQQRAGRPRARPRGRRRPGDAVGGLRGVGPGRELPRPHDVEAGRRPRRPPPWPPGCRSWPSRPRPRGRR